MNLRMPYGLLFLLCLGLSGCAIQRTQVAIPAGTTIETLYIERNFDTRLDPALTLIQLQLEELGIAYQVINGEATESETYHLEYDGEWGWDLATYPTRFTLRLYRHGRIIAGGEYDATMGGLRLDKFGTMENKIGPIIEDFFQTL